MPDIVKAVTAAMAIAAYCWLRRRPSPTSLGAFLGALAWLALVLFM